MRTASRLLLLLAACSCLKAGEHPRLLITADDVARIRHVSGVGEPSQAAQPSRFGAKAADYQAVRAHVAEHLGDVLLSGEMLAVAFLHLVTPDDDHRDERLRLLESAMAAPQGIIDDPLELAIAVDWCWLSLSEASRKEYIDTVRSSMKRLELTDSPLDPQAFREKLTSLAIALAIDDNDSDSAAWRESRASVLSAARDWYEHVAPTFVEWRSPTPTSSGAASAEETLTAIALEFGRTLLTDDPWRGQREGVGRWMEHYLYGVVDHPALRCGFLFGDGGFASTTPIRGFAEFSPLTANLITLRTRDRSAAAISARVEALLRAPDAGSRAAAWRWVPVVFDTTGIPRIGDEWPLARNLGGSIMIRAGSGPLATAIWIDAAQPFLRRRQHFDAGHFLIRAGGELLVDAADDVTFEAMPGAGGAQRLGSETKAFDYEQFATATIAHNALVLYEPTRLVNWYGVPFIPLGGQRPLEGTCRDFSSSITAQNRTTGSLTAFGNGPGAAYVALDLTIAYDPKVIGSYTREFVYHRAGVLFVIDRVKTVGPRSTPTLLFQLPSRPTLADGESLPEPKRLAGATNDAGIWRLDETPWLRWGDRDGAIWFGCLAPSAHKLRVIGGPARRETVATGPATGRTYIGGSADSFERLVTPAERGKPRNVWYRLGTPGLLGAQIGETPLWGRIELEPAEGANPHVFVSVFIINPPTTRPPMVRILHDVSDGNPAVVLYIADLADGMITLKIRDDSVGGDLSIGESTWPLPRDVEKTAPLGRN